MGGVIPPFVEVRGAVKRYGGAQALAGVDLEVRAGEIHCLVGENGAGKSTLGKLIAGVTALDEGELRVAGEPVEFNGPRDALRYGIAIVEQELSLVPAMTAGENVMLGYAPASAGGGAERVAELNREFGLDVNLGTPVDLLSLVEQQKVEILRALYRGARLVVMDEPTARLSGTDSEALLELTRRLSASGTAIVYVSHFLEEVLAVADRVTVLRDGHLVETMAAAGLTPEHLVTAMLGRRANLVFPPKRPIAADVPPLLSVAGLSSASGVEEVSFDLRPGEILALAGLVGSGRTEVAKLIFGADRSRGGSMTLDGAAFAPRSPRQAIRHGVAYLPESRKDLGLFLSLSSAENISAPHLHSISRAGLLSRRAEAREAQRIMTKLQVSPVEPLRQVRTLSGGNQQKVLFAKWLWREPKLLIADEPTRGVDVGAKFAIYEILSDLAAAGMAILLISSEVEEVLGLAHRVLVMSRGRVVATLADEEISEDAVLRASFAGQAREVPA